MSTLGACTGIWNLCDANHSYSGLPLNPHLRFFIMAQGTELGKGDYLLMQGASPLIS